MKEVSYIVVNWNTKRLTDACVTSLIEDSRGCDAEIIIVDNGSTDGSIEHIRGRHPGVRLICNGANLGFGRANNVGLRESEGEFVFLVNSDAELLRGCTREMIGCMRDNPRLAMLGPGVLDSDRRPQQSCWEFASLGSVARMSIGLRQSDPGRVRPGARGRCRRLAHHFLSGCALMVRREAMDEVGVFDERFFFYGEDMDWCRRMSDAGWSIAQLPSAVAIHRGGASSSGCDARSAIQAERALFQYIEKHRPAPLGIMRALRLLQGRRWRAGPQTPAERHRCRRPGGQVRRPARRV